MPTRQFGAPFRAALGNLLAAPPGDPVALFDADGTLWDGDATEVLLSWIDERGCLPKPEGAESILAHYDRLCLADKHTGYTWATTVFQGQRIDEVCAWSDACFAERMVPRVFSEMVELVGLFMSRGWDVYVVSASPWWALRAGTRAMGLPDDNILAMDLGRSGERFTDAIRRPITCGEGKVHRLRERVPGTPSFGAGNSMDDVPMLSVVSGLALVIDPSTMPENDLASLARSRGWFTHPVGS